MSKFKKLISTCSLLALLVAVGGCNAGDDSTTTNQSISAEVTSGNCTNMSDGDECEITITYNTNGESGLQLTFSPTSLPNSIDNATFYTTVGACGNTVGGSSGEYTCQNQPVIIEYVNSCTSNCGSPTGSQTTNLGFTFTLGDATSNSIEVSGY